MAKHIIAESYTFTPASRLIVINRLLRREQLMLITNVTKGTVIYNFSDPNLNATAFTNSTNALTAAQTTTIVLAYNTTAHSATDKIAILVERNSPTQKLLILI